MRFGVDTFIWSEVFSDKDLWVIPKAEELGFSTIDIAIAHPESFPTALVKAELAKTKLEVVTTTTLDANTNLISPNEAIRKNGVDQQRIRQYHPWRCELCRLGLSERETEDG